ncbi:MAG: hypothetical protein KDA78_08915 [Planctomycetaceae bacterium]|nr:hypothetical protein [Planctomycetaceae bacterium]
MFQSKRLSLQLTPLLDLLLIVIFAQYLEIEQSSHADTDQNAAQIARLEFQLAEVNKDLEFTKSVLQESQKQRFSLEADADSIREQAGASAEKMNQQISEVTAQRDRIVEGLRKAFENSSSEVRELLEAIVQGSTPPRPIQPEDVSALAESLATARPRDLATYLLAYHEIRKRCDIWNVHINEQEVIEVTIGEQKFPLRASSTEDFQQQFFNLYKSLPQTKGLVIILVSYGEVRATVRQQVLLGLPAIADRMRDDSAGRTRFEYAVVGYLPQEPAEQN